jgi:hypothetical protein
MYYYMINENCDGRHSFVTFLCYKMKPPLGLDSILSELQKLCCYGDAVFWLYCYCQIINNSFSSISTHSNNIFETME